MERYHLPLPRRDFMHKLSKEQREMLLEISDNIRAAFPQALSVTFDGDSISIEFIEDYERDGDNAMTVVGTSKYELRFFDCSGD